MYKKFFMPKNLVLLLLALWFASVFSAEVKYIEIPETSDPLNSMLPQGGILENTTKGYLSSNKNNKQQEHEIDFSNRNVTIKRSVYDFRTKTNFPLWTSHYPELAIYTMDMYDYGLKKFWLESLNDNQQEDMANEEGSVYDISIPVNLPPWMKDFGFDKPKLILQGSLDIRLNGYAQYTKDPNDSYDNLWPSPTPEFTPNFMVKGQVGRNITVEVNNTEGGLGVKNQMRVVYAEADSGEFDDYILQRVEAGHTSLSLEGTELTGYSENHQGLFGIKTDWKFGDLKLTAIASNEGGSQEQQSLKSSQTERTFQILDKQFNSYKYYFLTLAARNNYINAKINGNPYTYSRPNDLNFYKLSPQTDTKESDVLTEMSTMCRDENGAELTICNKFTNLNMVQLKENTDWEWVGDGVVKLNGVSKTSLIAAAWNGDGTGHTNGDRRDNQKLILIKPNSFSESNPLNKLMLRNIYSVGIDNSNKTNFRLSMKDKNQASGSFLYTLGVSDSLGVIKTSGDTLFLQSGGNKTGDMWLPCQSKDWYKKQNSKLSDAQALAIAKENCLEPMRNLSDTDNFYDWLYDKDISTFSRYSSQYYFEAVGKRKSSALSVKENGTYSVNSGGCIDIAPGTEKLKAGSDVLIKDVDYQVNYELGQIELISDKALDPNKEISVTYECEPLFEINNKLLLGMRAEFPIRKIGDNSLIGATILYKKQSVSQEQPQFGGEPFAAAIFGANLRLADSAQWMTSFINAIPLIKTDKISRWSVETEIARSYHNPNTSDSKSALLDDFESSEQSLRFSMQRTAWTQASPPGGVDSVLSDDNNFNYKHMGEFIWHSNIDEKYRNIYSESETNINNDEIDLLTLSLKPNDNLQGRSWGGIMRYNSSYYHNLENYKYIEIVARGNVGQLYIDLGAVSEDISISSQAPNGILNTEASSPTDYSAKNDYGLDGVSSEDEAKTIWDCRTDKCFSSEVQTSPQDTDPADDNFDKQTGDYNPSVHINGTEGNRAERSIDTEDLSKDGILDIERRFLRYKIDLEDYTAQETEGLKPGSGWYRYRIPLEDFNEIVAAQGESYEDILSDVRYTRLWYAGIKTVQAQVQIADFKIVGNQWDASEESTAYSLKEDDIIQEVEDDGSIFEILSSGAILSSDSNFLNVMTISNQDSSAGYVQSPNTIDEKDDDNGAILKEQSLVLKYGNLHPGQEVYAQKLFDSDSKDLTRYKSLQMEIHFESEEMPSDVRFAIRIGNEEQYYEWSFKPIPSNCESNACHEKNWRDNAFKLDLSEWTQLKSGLVPPYGEITDIPSTSTATERSEQIRMVGDPSATNVNAITFVIIADETAAAIGEEGSFWIDDLRVSGVNAEWGTASRTHMQMDFADVMGISGDLYYQDGTFATLSTQGSSSPLPTSSEAASQLNTRGGFNFNLNKFIDDAHGFKIPITLTYENNVSRPYLKPNSDLELSHDDFGDLGGDLVTNKLSLEDTLEEHQLRYRETPPESKGYQTFTERKGFAINYSKDYVHNEKIPIEILGQLLLERPQFNFNFNETESRSALTADSTYTWNTEISYAFGKISKTKDLKPFKKIKATNWWTKQFRSMTFSPWPQTFDVRLIDLSYQRNEIQDRNSNYIAPEVPQITNHTVDLNHKVTLNWSIFSWFNTSYNLDINRDMTKDNDKEAFTWENMTSKDKGGFFGTGYIADYDHNEKMVYRTAIIDSIYYLPKYNSLGEEITYIAGDTNTYTVVIGETGFYTVDSVSKKSYAKEYNILRNEQNRNQSFKVDFSPIVAPFLLTRFSFGSSYNHIRTMSDDYDPFDSDQISQNYWSMVQSNSFNFKPTLRLPELFGKNSIITKGLKKVSLRDIRFSWDVDMQTTGEEFSFAQLYNDQGVEGTDFLLYKLGLGDGNGWRSIGNLITGEHTFSERDYRRFAQYQSGTYDEEVYQHAFIHNVSRKASTGTNFTIPKGKIKISPNVYWEQEYVQRRDQPLYLDTSITWPRVSVGVSIPNFANKISFIKEHFKSVTANSRFEYVKSETRRPFQSAEDEFTLGLTFSPLIQVNMQTPKNIRISNSLRVGWERFIGRPKQQVITEPSWGLGDSDIESLDTSDYFFDTPWIMTDIFKEYTYSWGWDGSISYDLKTKHGFQLWKWYIKLENDVKLKLTTGFDFDKIKQYEMQILAGYYPLNEDESSDGSDVRTISGCKDNDNCPVDQYYGPVFDKETEEWLVPQRSWQFHIRPEASYKVTKNVDTNAFIEYKLLRDEYDSEESDLTHILRFEIGIMLRFN